ncbi:MAG: hypothetical protein ABI901_02995 [Roseiflexaceae bacterium]
MTEEQNPAQLESGAAPAIPPAAAAPTRGRFGCLGRFFSALLVIVITTFLALVAGASALLWFGYTPDTPRQLGAAQAQLATVQAQGDTLHAQNSVLQTEIAAQAQGYGTDHETLGEIGNQLANIADLRNALRDERQQSASQNATLVAEARDSRNAVAIFATIESDRAVLLADLDRRSARVERFLQRLSDISSDTALDLAATQAPVPPTSPPAQTTISELSPTPTQVPTSAPTVTSAPTATSIATSTSVATEPPTPTARRQSPTALSELSPTPTLGR